jgi:hypothetical protein
MNKWIVKQIVAISEVTGWPVPRLIRKFLPKDIFENQLNQERHLTASLRRRSPLEEKIPSSLVESLDRSLSRTERRPVSPARPSSHIVPLWAMSAAAMLLLALTLFLVYPGERGEEPARVPSMVTPASPTTVRAPDLLIGGEIPKLAMRSIDRDLVLRPLIQEQERLASDMTNALQYMANSFLPPEYAEQVNENLVSLKEEISGSI